MLQDVLKEILEEREKEATSREVIAAEDNGIVLVACKDERSCVQLENCITNCPKKVFDYLLCMMLYNLSFKNTSVLKI